jgi:hypothetical protein
VPCVYVVAAVQVQFSRNLNFPFHKFLIDHNQADRDQQPNCSLILADVSALICGFKLIFIMTDYYFVKFREILSVINCLIYMFQNSFGVI